MKYILKLKLLFLAIVTLAGCSSRAQNNTTETMLKDTLKRNEIMKAINNDQQMRMEMMAQMMTVRDTTMHSMMNQMMGDKEMMLKMMRQDTTMGKMMMGNLMEMMEADSAMCCMMNDMMMGSSHLAGMMHGKAEIPMQNGMRMCPMHGNMKNPGMKKEENKHH